jgi:PsbN protein
MSDLFIALKFLMIRNIIRIILFVIRKTMLPATVLSIQDMEPATVVILAIAAFLLAITGLSIYTSFGPPSKELSDPFEDHED